MIARALLAACIILAASPFARAVTVDSFLFQHIGPSGSPAPLVTNATADVEVTQFSSGFLGGSRRTRIHLENGSAPVPALGSGHAAVTIGLLLLAVLASTITRRRRAAALSRSAVAALLCAAGLAGVANSSSACGDVDVDGDVSVSDVAAFRLFLANPEGSPLTDAGFAQCTVHGRARPCDVLDLVVLRRSVQLGPDQQPLGGGCDDGDLDGVDDDADQCPETPPGAPTLAAAPGCSPLDVISRPESLTEPAADALVAGIDILASPDFAPYPELADLLSVAQGSLYEMDLAVSNLRAGSLCAGAGAYRAMVDLLESRRGVVEDGWQVLQLRIQTAGPALPVGADGSQHFGDGHIHAMVLSLAMAELDEGIARAQTAAGAFDASCSSVTGPVIVSGRVARIDDALHTIVLETGGTYALTSGTTRGPFTSGQIIDLSGTGLGGAIGIATEVAGDELISGNPGPLGVDCMSLRVAPVQAFAPFVMSPPTYHHLTSYETSEGVIELEDGMRFATVRGSCPGSSSYPSYLRYTMRIMINGLPVADELLPSDPPVFIPPNIPRNTLRTMDVAVQKQVCIYAPGNDPCGPITDLRTETHTVRIRAKGAHCVADYEDRALSLEDNDLVGYATTRVVGTIVDSNVIPGSTGPVFRAESCLAIPGATSCSSGTIVTTYENQPFRLYNHDFYPLYGPSNWFHHYQSEQKYGVGTAAGLRWPRVQGTRSARPFWYSCGIPQVTRDVVDFCPSPPDSYYRYPLYPGGVNDPRGWTVGSGNGTSSPGHAGDQFYAWDITAALGSSILAARPGLVTLLRESATDFSSTIDGLIESDECYKRLPACFDSLGTGTCASNSDCTSPRVCQSGKCVTDADVTICTGFYPCDLGNYLWVRHQDGTFGIYFHMRQNGVLVQLGDIVRRSNPIGEVGDTGYSTQEHLHFQSHSIPDAFSVLSVFQQSSEVAAPDNICHLPLNGERLPSSNHPNDFY